MNHADQIGIRVIVDLVVNHTSERHPWFQSARKDPKSPYRNWYLWSKTPMQWSADTHGGFSTARRTILPVISDPIYGYKRVNVEAQRRDPHSLLNWVERRIRMRKECPEISWGDWKILRPMPTMCW
jgi:glycosidase